MNVDIKDSIFEREQNAKYDESTQSLNFQHTDWVKIENTAFRNMAQQKGGAVKAKEVLKVVIKDSLFSNNQAFLSGGALYLEDCSKARVVNNSFSGNRATKIDGGHLDLLDY